MFYLCFTYVSLMLHLCFNYVCLCFAYVLHSLTYVSHVLHLCFTYVLLMFHLRFTDVFLSVICTRLAPSLIYRT